MAKGKIPPNLSHKELERRTRSFKNYYDTYVECTLDLLANMEGHYSEQEIEEVKSWRELRSVPFDDETDVPHSSANDDITTSSSRSRGSQYAPSWSDRSEGFHHTYIQSSQEGYLMDQNQAGISPSHHSAHYDVQMPAAGDPNPPWNMDHNHVESHHSPIRRPSESQSSLYPPDSSYGMPYEQLLPQNLQQGANSLGLDHYHTPEDFETDFDPFSFHNSGPHPPPM